MTTPRTDGREPYRDERTHDEKRPGGKHWWRCVPIEVAREWEAAARQQGAQERDAELLRHGQINVGTVVGYEAGLEEGRQQGAREAGIDVARFTQALTELDHDYRPGEERDGPCAFKACRGEDHHATWFNLRRILAAPSPAEHGATVEWIGHDGVNPCDHGMSAHGPKGCVDCDCVVHGFACRCPLHATLRAPQEPQRTHLAEALRLLDRAWITVHYRLRHESVPLGHDWTAECTDAPCPDFRRALTPAEPGADFRAALLEYGSHDPGCDGIGAAGKCWCGFAEVQALALVPDAGR